MSEGLSDANKPTDYGFDPVFGICNACGKGWCTCAVDRIAELEKQCAELRQRVKDAEGHARVIAGAADRMAAHEKTQDDLLRAALERVKTVREETLENIARYIEQKVDYYTPNETIVRMIRGFDGDDGRPLHAEIKRLKLLLEQERSDGGHDGSG